MYKRNSKNPKKRTKREISVAKVDIRRIMTQLAKKVKLLFLNLLFKR